jgi:hypothetical protein
MPVSNDNQDYGEKDKQNSANRANTPANQKVPGEENLLTSDDLKGKKVDADPEKESEKPADV